jgi:hypothetical protein
VERVISRQPMADVERPRAAPRRPRVIERAIVGMPPKAGRSALTQGGKAAADRYSRRRDRGDDGRDVSDISYRRRNGPFSAYAPPRQAALRSRWADVEALCKKAEDKSVVGP